MCWEEKEAPNIKMWLNDQTNLPKTESNALFWKNSHIVTNFVQLSFPS